MPDISSGEMSVSEPSDTDERERLIAFLRDGIELHEPVRTEVAKKQADAILAIVDRTSTVGSSRVDLQACKLEYSIVSPK